MSSKVEQFNQPSHQKKDTEVFLHLPERAPSEDTSVEHLTSEEVKEREEIVARIRQSIHIWIAEHIPDGETFNTRRLSALIKYIGTDHAEDVNRITELFRNQEKYVSRPCVTLLKGEKGLFPDIELLGWRGAEGGDITEKTEVHDHMDSQAAIFVHEGMIREKIFAFNQDDWKEGKPHLEYQEVRRELSQGSTVGIAAPYIHEVFGIHDQPLAVTIHAYYPPLDEMNFYKISGQKLVKVRHWKE